MIKSDLTPKLKSISSISIDFDGTIMPLYCNQSFINPQSAFLSRPITNLVELVLVSIVQHIQLPEIKLTPTLKLLSKKFTLHVLTSRPGHLSNLTKSFLNNHLLSQFFTQIEHNLQNEAPPVQKTRYIKRHKINLHIDDDPVTIARLSAKLPSTYFIYFNKLQNYTPVNHLNTYEVTSWQEIFELFANPDN